jgi:hypothetical protein
MKRRLVSLAVVSVVVAAMLLLSEWVVRLLYAEETVLFPRYHTDVQYGDYTIRRIRPNSRFRHTSRDGSWEFITNSQGFRNVRDFEYDKPAGVVRVLSIGDSHTQGYEVRQEHTFSAVLERYLSVNGVPSEVLNAGVSGFSTAEALVLLENEGLRYAPDVVVLGFFGNDLEDNLKAGLFALDDSGELVPTKHVHVPGVRIQNIIYSVPGIKWLGENSYFYSLLFNTTWDLFKKRLADSAREQVTEFAVPQQDVYSDYEIDLTAALLARLYEVSQQNAIKLVVVDIPLQVVDQAVVSSFPGPLRDRAEQFSDAFIDSETLFSDYAGVTDLHMPHGHHHITEFSHTLIGAAVGRAILGSLTDETPAIDSFSSQPR